MTQMIKPRQTLTVIGPHGSEVTVLKPGLGPAETEQRGADLGELGCSDEDLLYMLFEVPNGE
jgi:hypothetical protein